MKKKLLYLLTLIPVILLSGCRADRIPQQSHVNRAVIRFDINAPLQFTRSASVDPNDEYNVMKLSLLVFDQNGLFVESVQAMPTGVSSLNGLGTGYKATISQSNSKRIIHFVANVDLPSSAAEMFKFRDERDIISSLKTDRNTPLIAMWRRIECSSIEPNADLGDVYLLRNRAKIQLINMATNFELLAYTLCNERVYGTVSVFRPSAITGGEFFFEATNEASSIDFVTRPFDPTIFNPSIDTDLVAASSTGEVRPLYAYESDVNDETETMVIVKGRYEGVAYYYKLVVQDAQDNHLSIFRNNLYLITIRNVAQKGYNTLAAAISGIPSNSFAMDKEIERLPLISDGLASLSVSPNVVVSTSPNLGVAHEVSVVLTGGDLNLSLIRTSVLENDASSPAILGTPTFDPSTGVLSFRTTEMIPNKIKMARIKVTVDGRKNLTRYIFVSIQEAKYPLFTANGSGATVDLVTNPSAYTTVSKVQNSPLTFVFKVDPAIPRELYPLDFTFYTDNFYPDAGQTMRFANLNQKPTWTLTIPEANFGKTFTVQFKSNKASSAESIKVTNKYYTDKLIRIN